MPLHSSAETHGMLLERIPEITGRSLPEWLECLNNGPSLLRLEERVQWLRMEHELPLGYANAIVHEQECRRVAGRV
ncbi:MAG: DUF4287 domain-containing protein [Actinomycetota bacterium]|nr:DUF4287 domain-containing protein [Actinomycetota bacterium]